MTQAVKQGVFCKMRGVTKGRGSQWRKAGLLVLNADGLVLVEETNALLDARLDVGKRAASTVVSAGVKPVAEKRQVENKKEPQDRDAERDTFAAFNKARADKEQELAITARLDREEREGTLVKADDVRAAASQLATLIAAGLDMLPARIGALLANESDPAKREALVEDECRRLREDFAARAAELMALRNA